MTVGDHHPGHMPSMPPKGRVTTFYSYRGGVGRTSTLAGVAMALASRHGRKVLAIDWDLETPDLHSAFGHDDGWAKGRPGLLEYIGASKSEFRRVQDYRGGKDVRPGVQLEDFVVPILPAQPETDGGGRLDLLSAGDLGSGYLERLRRLDWQEAYAHEGGFWIMERLRLQAAELYDTVLIDARAGRSETSLIPLLQLSDIVAIVFPPIEAGIASTYATIASLAGAQRGDRLPPAIMLVPALLRAGTTLDALEGILNGIAGSQGKPEIRFLELLKEGLPLALPYDTELALGKHPTWFASSGISSGLESAYGRIAEVILEMPTSTGHVDA